MSLAILLDVDATNWVVFIVIAANHKVTVIVVSVSV
jgi:hypothetical protein